MIDSDTRLDMGKCRVALGDPDTHGFVLLTILLWAFKEAVFGDEDLGIEAMDPSELWAAANETFGTWVTDEGENKVNALIMAMDTPLYFQDVEAHCAVANALFDGDLGDMLSGKLEQPSVVELMWAALEVELARDDRDERPPFSRNVMDFLVARFKAEQEDLTEANAAIEEEYQDLLHQLQTIGVPLSAIRVLDEEYAEVVEALLDMQS